MKVDKMINLQSLKDISLLLQVCVTIFKSVVDLGSYIYKTFFAENHPEQKQNTGKGEMISSSMYSTQIIEEIAVFKDDNGETKTTISRRILKKFTNPDPQKVANDNFEDKYDNEDGAVNYKKIADLVCNENNADKSYCKQLVANDERQLSGGENILSHDSAA